MPESQDSTERLTEAVEQLSEDINGLMEVAEQGTLLQELVDEVRTLRSAIDDVRTEIEWAARNLAQRDQWVPQQSPITSMPLDPCDPAFASRLNAVSRHDLSGGDGETLVDADAATLDEEANDTEAEVEEDTSSADECAASAPPVKVPTMPPAEHRGTTKKQPLSTRLFLHRHLADLVRLIGHDEHLAEDFGHMVKPLFEKHGAETVKSAIDEVVLFEHRERQAFARLKPDVQKLAVQIIGHPPAPVSTGDAQA